MVKRYVGVVANPRSDAIKAALESVLEILGKYNIEPLLEIITADIIGSREFSTNKEIYDKAEFIIALGGDGTVLLASNISDNKQIPILGIHMGRLGFITAFCRTVLIKSLEDTINGKLNTHKRMRLECEVVKGGEVLYTASALNEFALNKSLGRMVHFNVFCNDKKVSDYRADGFIISTPTGSTGYSLSVGGPIIHPDMELMVLSPISSHAVNTRSIVVPADSVIRIELTERQEDTYIIPDGRIGKEFQYGETLYIKKSKTDTIMYYDPEQTFFNNLRVKLNWGKDQC